MSCSCANPASNLPSLPPGPREQSGVGGADATTVKCTEPGVKESLARLMQGVDTRLNHAKVATTLAQLMTGGTTPAPAQASTGRRPASTPGGP